MIALTPNEQKLIQAIREARIADSLKGLYNDLIPFLRAHGVKDDAMTIAHFFEAVVVDSRYMASRVAAHDPSYWISYAPEATKANTAALQEANRIALILL